MQYSGSSCLQDQTERAHLCLDFQPQVQRKTGQVDFGWRGITITDIVDKLNNITPIQCKRQEVYCNNKALCSYAFKVLSAVQFCVPAYLVAKTNSRSKYQVLYHTAKLR